MGRSVILTVVLALLLTACGEGGSTASSPGTPPEAGPASKAPGTTPEATFTALQQAFADKDWTAVIGLQPPSQLAAGELAHREKMDEAYAEGIAGMLGMEPEQVLSMTFAEYSAAVFGNWAERNAEEFASMQSSKLLATEIDGDKATLMLKAGDDEQEIEFRREDGLWYWGRG